MIVKMGYMLQKEERRMGGGNVSQDQTSIICIDLKSFYASVECVERGLNPFKTNLVVADPTRSKSTICLAITPAMKALGIKNRCRIHEIPDCVKYITAMPRMQLYMDYSAKIYGIYLRYVSKEDIHVYSVDECFIDVTNYLQLYHLTAKEMAVKLMQAVMEETGITATAGVGTNLYLAKIAMDLVIAEKPSVSRAIAEVIGAQEREDGYLQGTDCMVSWCFGHLAEYVSPDAYRHCYTTYL